MLLSCCIIGCKSNSERKIPDVSFHTFPVVEHVRRKWILATGRSHWTPTPWSKICSDHFEKNQFIRRTKVTRLFPDAVPILNQPTHRDVTPEKDGRSTLDQERARRWSTSTTTQTEVDQDLNSLLDEVGSTIGEEEVEESIVPITKPFTRGKKRKTKRLKIDDVDDVDDTEDNMSMYLDVDEQSSNSSNTEDKNDEVLHDGFVCNVCQCEIKGFRYTCVQCNDFDLCSACENNKAHHHHYVLRVPEPRPYVEIQFVLATIRRHLLKKLDPITQFEQDDDTISIKSEIKSEIEDDELSEPAADDTPTLHSIDGDNAVDNMVIDTKEEIQSNTREEKRNVQNSKEVASLNVAVQHKQQPFSVAVQQKQQPFSVALQQKLQSASVTIQHQRPPIRVAVQQKQQPVSVSAQNQQKPVRVAVQHQQQPVKVTVQNKQSDMVAVQNKQEPVIVTVQPQQQPVSVAVQHQQQSAVTSGEATSTGLHISAKNNNIIIDFNDAPKVIPSTPKAKKIQILPFPKTESSILTQKLLSQKPLLRPGQKVMLVKCPSGMLLKDGRKVPVQVLPTWKSTRSNVTKEKESLC